MKEGMEIKEKISFLHHDFASAEVIANENGWKIKFAFRGPDLRYNFDYLTISPNELPHFRQGLLGGMEKYIKMKNILDATSEMVDTFGYVTIRVGGIWDGVCIMTYRLRIKDSTTMNSFISALDKAKQRGSILVSQIRNIT